MTKQVILTFLFLLLSITAHAQYRAFTVEGMAGKGLDTNTEFFGGSTNFHWDFNDKWFIQNWNGISYDIEQPQQRWMSSEVTINRGLGETKTFSIGSGLQYRNSMVNNVDGFYIVVKARKTIRL